MLNRSYSLSELEPARSRAGIRSGVLVQAANNREDTEWMLTVAAGSSWIEGVVGWLPLADPVETNRQLEVGFGAGSKLKGVRHLIHNEANPAWLLQEPVLESLGLLAGCGIPYDVVGIHAAHLRTALRVAYRYPALRMVLDHLNQPPFGAPEKAQEWRRLMTEAASHPNLYVKISGLGTAAAKGREWTAADLEPWLDFAFGTFGPDRCMCGGDWPVCLLAGSYEETWKAYREIIEKYLDREDRERLYSDTARSFYGLGSHDVNIAT